MNPQSTLRIIKVMHSIAWAFFAGCILAIPVYAWLDDLSMAAILSAVVFIEVLILLFNNRKCPFTPLAARYTEDRKANFDIYLPEWLARHNKEIFGSLYVAGLVYIILKWIGWLA